MKDTTCEQLDDYLDGTLAGDALEVFEAHLENCDACRRAVDEHHQTLRLLRQGVDQHERAPALLRERTARAMRRQDHWRRMRLVAGLATAAALLIGVGLALRTQPSPVNETGVDTNTIAEVPPEPSPSPKSLVRVTVLNPDEAIAVPIETKSENVTIVWIYPTVKVAANGAAGD